MPSYVYTGMTQKQMDEMVKARCAGIGPQDRRGTNAIYTIKNNDNEKTKEEKRKAFAEWVAKEKVAIKKDVEGLSAQRSVCGVVFKCGEPVKVEPGSALEAKLVSMMKAKVCPFKVAEDKGEKKPKE